MINEKELIAYLESKNERFVFIIPNKDKLPTVEEIKEELTVTHDSLHGQTYGYWQTVKDFASLHILLTIVSAYDTAKKYGVDITGEVLDSLSASRSPVPFGVVFSRNLKTYVTQNRHSIVVDSE